MNSLASSLKKLFHSTIHCFLGKDVLLCIIKLGRKKKLEVNEEELSQVGFFLWWNMPTWIQVFF